MVLLFPVYGCFHMDALSRVIKSLLCIAETLWMCFWISHFFTQCLM